VSYDALDDFAGPGGWDVGAAMVGLRTVGIEWDMAACQTAVAAGHDRIRADVAAYPSEPFAGIPGYIASPPCQAWSMAGKRGGELDRANCHTLADRMAQGDDSTDWTDWEDPRSPLVCQPVRRVRELQPEWVALEEVPAVLGLWQHFARIFRAWGYWTWVGILNAADYGVPQTRQRVILMASRVKTVTPPEPTHSRDPDEGDLFGASRLGWVSMAQALGWAGLLDRRTNSKAAGGGMTPTVPVPTHRPAPTLTGQAGAQWVLHYRRDSPKWVAEHGPRDDRPVVKPAPTFTGEAHRWTWERPATSVLGDPRIGRPGHKDRDKGESQFQEGSVRVSVAEAATLQSFPGDYPWHGNKGQQYQQVGNAIPPLLGAHVLAALTGAEMRAAA
jgi:DNA (cytosine-5)-methyltransferase 1